MSRRRSAMFPRLDLTPRIHYRPVSAPAWTLKASWISYPSGHAVQGALRESGPAISNRAGRRSPTLREDHPPYSRPTRHQLMAFRRLCGADDAGGDRNGPRKDRAIIYQILDYCATAAGPGSKAIVIDPMNALATDQAQRC